MSLFLSPVQIPPYLHLAKTMKDLMKTNLVVENKCVCFIFFFTVVAFPLLTCFQRELYLLYNFGYCVIEIMLKFDFLLLCLFRMFLQE